MFDKDLFIEACLAAVKQSEPQRNVRDLVREAISGHGNVEAALGTPVEGGITTVYRSDELTILNVVWAPQMTIYPHDHRMWAVIGIYTGREDNIFWRRADGSPAGKLEATAAKALGEGDAVPLGRDVIHSVTNPIPRLTGALHVYGGDFFGVARSEWNAETLLEQPSSGEKMARRFEEANALWNLSTQSNVPR